MEGFLVFLLFLGLFVNFVILVKAAVGDDDVYNLVFSFLGIIFLAIVLVKAPFSGEPSKEIHNGVYEVSFIQERGPDVVLGLEGKENKTERNLRVYIFPKDAFSGEIKKESKQLRVSETGDFRKLVLE
ncbi:MAG: hypothetical protein HYX21_00465 [Candidatus Yanofskybacteria bacterium]|nr:hypothetical protein [Candidatus Yanofskybacteria bacterium]